MPGDPSNPLDELDGLQVALQNATRGVLPGRTVTVLTHNWDGNYDGNFPMILVRPSKWRSYRLSGGQTGGTKGSDGRKPSLYSIVLHDQVNTRAVRGSTAANTVGKIETAQRALETLVKAIGAYWAVAPNTCLPVGGVNTVKVSGEYLDFDQVGAFKIEDAGVVRVVMAGVIDVWGIPYRVTQG